MLCALVCVALAGGWNAKLLPIFDDGAPRDLHAVLRQNFRELLIAVGGACRLCGDKLLQLQQNLIRVCLMNAVGKQRTQRIHTPLALEKLARDGAADGGFVQVQRGGNFCVVHGGSMPRTGEEECTA